MYVETDFLFAIAKPDDWLQDEARAALDTKAVHTSILSYAEFLLRAYSAGEGFDFDVARTTANLLELVPVRPASHEDAILTAATYIDEHGLTPFDALHAGLAATNGDSVLSSEQAYESLELTRVPLEPETEDG